MYTITQEYTTLNTQTHDKMALVVKGYIFSISCLQYLRENQGQIEEYTTYVTEQSKHNQTCSQA